LVTQGDGDAADGRRDATNDSPCTLGGGCEGGILRQQRTTTMRATDNSYTVTENIVYAVMIFA
jgi:hypothetical protein